MKTISGMMFEAQEKWLLWLDISKDPQALEDRNKTEHEAEVITNYFEGVYDGLTKALRVIDKE